MAFLSLVLWQLWSLSGCSDGEDAPETAVGGPTSTEASSYCEMVGETSFSVRVNGDSITFIANTGTPDEDRTGSAPLRELRNRGGFHLSPDEAGQRLLIAVGPAAGHAMAIDQQTIPMDACRGFTLPVGVGRLPDGDVTITLTDEQGRTVGGGPIAAGQTGGVGLFAAVS